MKERRHFSDLRQTLKDFSDDSRKTSQNTLSKSSNAFYVRRFPTKSVGSLLPKVVQILDKFWKTSHKTLGRLSEDFLGSLLMYLEVVGKSSKVFCPRWYKGMMSTGVQTYLCGGIISTSINLRRLLALVRRLRENFQKTSIEVFSEKTSREVFYKKSNF
ncbi:hypothetical protein YC2023_045338 [Brassica napus]